MKYNAANDGQKRSIWVDWISDICLLQRPAPDTPEGKVLAEAKITTASKWHEFTKWLVWVAMQTGKYGENMQWSQLAIAEHTHHGPKRVRQWLQVAEALGFIRMSKPATAYTPAVYAIAHAWREDYGEPADDPQPRMVQSLDADEHDDWTPNRRRTYLETLAESTGSAQIKNETR